jgi:Ser/Thr protein kinase RdoA (MazF antagonist)
LSEKGLSITDLYWRLNDKNYYLSLESLYRYFNPSSSSNRFPPQDFLEAFSEVLQLTEEESEALLLFWRYWKLAKKIQCSQ